MLNKIENGLWVIDQPQSIMGVELGARMTVVALSGDNGLAVHSPIKLTQDLTNELKKIGTVQHVIAPNLMHHLYIGEYKVQYPSAKLYCAPGLEYKRRDIVFDEVIQENKEYLWSKDLQHHVVSGSPMCNEVVFYSKKLRTLVVTDLGIHICEDHPPLTRLLFKAMGMFKKFGWSKFEKWIFVKNKKMFKASITKILSWDFDRIILSHGRIVENNGRAIFGQAFE